MKSLSAVRVSMQDNIMVDLSITDKVIGKINFVVL